MDATRHYHSGFGKLCRSVLGLYRDSAPMMENDIEENTESEMETRVCRGQVTNLELAKNEEQERSMETSEMENQINNEMEMKWQPRLCRKENANMLSGCIWEWKRKRKLLSYWGLLCYRYPWTALRLC